VRDPTERLRDMLDAIAAIDRYRDRDRASFDRDELLQVWFLRHLQILGEATAGLPQDVRGEGGAPLDQGKPLLVDLTSTNMLASHSWAPCYAEDSRSTGSFVVCAEAELRSMMGSMPAEGPFWRPVRRSSPGSGSSLRFGPTAAGR
jgi:hypothetical protein